MRVLAGLAAFWIGLEVIDAAAPDELAAGGALGSVGGRRRSA